MTVISKDMAQPDTRIIADPTRQNLDAMADKWKPREESPLDMAGPLKHKKRPLTLTGWKRKVAVGLAAGSVLVGSHLILSAASPGAQGQAPETPAPTLTPAETQKDKLKVADLNRDNPPTDIFNGTVAIRINKEKDTPVLTTNPGGLLNKASEPYNIESFANITEINGSPIAQAVDSNGAIELVLTQPLVTRDNLDKGLAWVTMISNGKPLYVQMGGDNSGKVLPESNGTEIFLPIPKGANVLDYGQVDFLPAPTQ